MIFLAASSNNAVSIRTQVGKRKLKACFRWNKYGPKSLENRLSAWRDNLMQEQARVWLRRWEKKHGRHRWMK